MSNADRSSSESLQPPSDSKEWEWDRVFLNSRREAWGILVFWLSALVWCVPVSYLLGYQRGGESVDRSTLWGVPAWLFWGVALPWLISILASTWFCFRVMKDDPLEVDPARLSREDESLSKQRGAS